MLDSSFFNLNSLYQNKNFNLTINDFAFPSVHSYFCTGLWCLGRGNIQFTDFRIVFIAHIYSRIYRHNITVTPLIDRLIATYGVPPGWNNILSFLPVNGIISFTNFCSLTFVLDPKLKNDVETALNNGELNLAVTRVKRELTRDNILCDNFGANLKDISITFSNFINVNEQIKHIFFDTGSVKMTFSLRACLIFGLTVDKEFLDDFKIICSSKYVSTIADSAYSIAVTTLLHDLFGVQVGFGRQLVSGSEKGVSHGYVNYNDRTASSTQKVLPSFNRKGSNGVLGDRSLSFRSLTNAGIAGLTEAEKLSLLSLVFKLRLVK